jgi:hypothetical protein
MRKLKKHPASRANEASALIEVFCPNRSVARKRRMARKFLARIRVLGPAKDWKILHELTGLGIRRDRLQRKIVVGTDARIKLRGGLAHELVHFFGFGKNHLLTANALSGYLSRRGATSKRRIDYKPWLSDAEAILKGSKWLRNPGYEHDKDVDLGHAGTAIDNIGMRLGEFAADKERQWKKPASGLFLIREACNGILVKDAIKSIELGQLDKEIQAFEKNHLAKLFPRK